MIVYLPLADRRGGDDSVIRLNHPAAETSRGDSLKNQNLSFDHSFEAVLSAALRVDCALLPVCGTTPLHLHAECAGENHRSFSRTSDAGVPSWFACVQTVLCACVQVCIFSPVRAAVDLLSLFILNDQVPSLPSWVTSSTSRSSTSAKTF